MKDSLVQEPILFSVFIFFSYFSCVVLTGNILNNSSLSICLKRCSTRHPSFLIFFKNVSKTLFSVFMRTFFRPYLHKHLTAVVNAASNCVNINNLCCQRGNINRSNIQFYRDEKNC